MAKFKIGDRVRLRENYSTWPAGTEGTIRSIIDSDLVYTDTVEGAYDWRFDKVATITLTTEKHYRTRNGKVTGRLTKGDTGFEAIVDGHVRIFDKAGGHVHGDSGLDIVEAWVPKVGERVRLIKEGKSTTGAIGKPATLVTWGSGAFIDNNHYLLDIDPPVDYRTLAVTPNFTRATIDCFEPLPVAAPAQPAVWVPAVGDKVVWREVFASDMYTKGKVYEIRDGRNGYFFLTDDKRHAESGNHQWNAGAVALHFDRAQPLKIEAGRCYKTRDGRKVGPMRKYDGDSWKERGGRYLWRDNGERYFESDRGGATDLIAEWIDEPAAQPTEAPTASNDNAAPAKFKVGDRVVATKDDLDITEGMTYEIKEVDDKDELMPVAVIDDIGDFFWLTAGRFELVTAPVAKAIVALIEDGAAKPSSKPKVHASQEDATVEAERLALAHPGQLFGVFVLADSKIADVVNVPTPVLRAA